MCKTRLLCCLTIMLIAAAPARAGELPSPATGGADGGPIDLLFLRGNIEIGFGQPVPLDKTLVEKLTAHGFRVHVARDFNPLTMEYLRQFEVVIWVGISPAYAQSRLYSPVGWQGGMHMLTVQKNAELLQRYVREGGGLLLNPGVEELGMQVVPSHDRLLAPYGLDTQCAQVRDGAHQTEFYKVLGRYPYYMSWTEKITPHPTTAGVERIWYPAYTMRWDDNVTTLPLYPKDEAWTPLVKAEPTARASWYRGTPYEQGHWKADEEGPQPVLVAVRPFGKGRVGVISIGHFHLFYYPYSKARNHREILFGPQQGVLMEKGMEGRESNLAQLMSNLYRWLAEAAAEAGIGTYDAEAPVPLPDIPEQPVANRSDVWAKDDPLTKGKVRPLKILVGARTAASDGEGTVADYKAAARTAGYDIVAFTETFEHLTSEKFRTVVDQCKRLSDDEVYLLPGIDVADNLGNRFLLLGKDTPIRPHLLVEKETEEPGKRLIWTGHMLIGMGEVLPVAARPQRLATVREFGALPPDLYSHCPGVAVATYKDGKLVDDGLFAYRWHLFNATIPVPVAVHEVYSPQAVATAAGAGLQTMINGDTPESGANYFRQGHMAFGGNPMRTYLSSGPVVEHYDIDDWLADPWTVTLRARADVPITDVVVRDQRDLYRWFRPQARPADVAWRGNQGAQHWFLVELRDANGGRAIMSPLRTLPGRRGFVRCMDRQNWFSGLHFGVGVTYTGRLRSMPLKVRPMIAVPGAAIPGTWAPKLQLTYNGPGHTVVDYRLDAVVESRGRPLGADASPIFNCRPVKEFEGLVRYWFYMGVKHRGSRPQWTVLDYRVRLKQDLKAKGAVWPILTRLKGTPKYLDPKTGAMREVNVPRDGAAKLPAGAWIGGNVLLDPATVDANGAIGPAEVPAPGTMAKAGRQWRLRVMPWSGKQPETVLALMGFVGTLPYGLDLTQGALREVSYAPQFVAADGGVAGQVAPPAVDMPRGGLPGIERLVPVHLHQGNPNWPLGLWTAVDGNLQPYDYLDGIGRGRLPIGKKTDFYFGSLLWADQPALHLAFVRPWTAEQAAISVHNPTAQPITATVRTAAAVADRKQWTGRLTVPPGKTLLVGQ